MQLIAHDNLHERPWVPTVSGRRFYFLEPAPEDIRLVDFAHSLSHLCRYVGACRRYYSVAEHCVLMAEKVPAEDRLWALLHDAPEGYIGDVTRGLKRKLGGYKEIEDGIMRAICEKFGLSYEMPESVAYADNAISTDEIEQNANMPFLDMNRVLPPLGVTLQYWEPERARYEYTRAVQAALNIG